MPAYPARIDPRNGNFSTASDHPADRLDRAIRAARPDLSWGQIRGLIERGKVRVAGTLATEAGQLVPPGSAVSIDVAAPRRSKAAGAPPLAAERVLHQDREVVVVDKPAGLPTVPFGDQSDTLDQRLKALLGQPVHVVQRLDRDTSGVLVFARTRAAFEHLEHQFRRHTVHRRYLALAHGEVAGGTIRTFLGPDRGDGLRGSIPNQELGKEAITHVEPLQALRGATLIACRLETGRTHQIRIHLAERGHMLLGERGYVRDHQGPVLPAPRLMLHAAELGFVHPGREVPMRFQVPLPDDMTALLDSLRPA